MLKEKFLGTFDVHVNNLVAPHQSRSTRLLDHEHVNSLTDSYKENNFWQFVILVGMLLDTATDPARLGEEGYTKVEVLGGNHTREALQSLLLKGALSCSVVKANIYEPLPVSAALAKGYQHNAILKEKRRPLQFIKKVSLMRYCRLSDSMTKDELLKWKDMLVVVFRTKDRRKLMNMYAKHMHMAQLPDHIWTKVMRAADKVGQVSEKFFRPMMRLVNNEKIERCLDTLIDIGLKEFKNQVIQNRHHETTRNYKEFRKGQTVEAFWKDENGEEWLKAEILKVNKNDKPFITNVNV